MSLIAELRRRNVLRVGAAYVVSSWLVIQVVETIFPVYGLSDAAIRLVISALAVGFIPVLVLAWVFELTPEGLRREGDIDGAGSVSRNTGKKLDRAIIIVLAIGIGYFAFDKFVLSQSREAAIAEAAREQGRTESIIDSYGDKSIAVLPFDDMSPGADQEYMSDGIAEEILNLLAKVSDLRVISRSSTFAFKGASLSMPEMAARLNAAYILEGSVRLAGDQLRITAQLIEAGSDTHIWSETYDRKLENVFDIQDDIAAAVVEELKSALLGGTPRSTRIDEQAYRMVLHARYLWWRRAEGDEQEALALYERAVDIDPGYAPAWTGLSVAYAVAAQKGQMDHTEGYRKAREAVGRALALDPENIEARIRLGQALGRERDQNGMLAEYQKAYESDPDNPLVLGVLAMQAAREGRIDDLVDFYDRAVAVDPLSAIWHGNKGHQLAMHGRPDEAEAAVRRSLALSGSPMHFQDVMVNVHFLRGEFDKALESLATLGDGPGEGYNTVRRAIMLHALGRHEESDEILAQTKAVQEPPAILGVAMIYAARGENDLAFEWLYKVDGDAVRPWNIVYDTYTRALVDDPRWKPFVDSLEWPWEHEY